MMTAYDTVTGGGLYWEEGKLNTKNTCSNGPGIILALQLYKATQQKSYLDTALLLYNWVNSHLRDTAGLYYDNIAVPGGKIDTRRYSYNTGTMLQSAMYLYELTRNRKYLDEAKVIAAAAKTYFYGSGQLRDGYWFNAVLLRGYQHLLRYDKDLSYVQSFAACIDHALKNNRNEHGLMIARNNKTVDLTNQAGMLEILARLAWLEKKYRF
jgi:predicted alpha-1,6-mannanase (GH76 family)